MDSTTLVEWQHRRGFTQGQAADALGVPLTTYRNWLKGRAQIIRPQTIEKLMDYIDRFGLLTD